MRGSQRGGAPVPRARRAAQARPRIPAIQPRGRADRLDPRGRRRKGRRDRAQCRRLYAHVGRHPRRHRGGQRSGDRGAYQQHLCPRAFPSSFLISRRWPGATLCGFGIDGTRWRSMPRWACKASGKLPDAGIYPWRTCPAKGCSPAAGDCRRTSRSVMKDVSQMDEATPGQAQRRHRSRPHPRASPGCSKRPVSPRSSRARRRTIRVARQGIQVICGCAPLGGAGSIRARGRGDGASDPSSHPGVVSRPWSAPPNGAPSPVPRLRRGSEPTCVPARRF